MVVYRCCGPLRQMLSRSSGVVIPNRLSRANIDGGEGVISNVRATFPSVGMIVLRLLGRLVSVMRIVLGEVIVVDAHAN